MQISRHPALGQELHAFAHDTSRPSALRHTSPKGNTKSEPCARLKTAACSLEKKLAVDDPNRVAEVYPRPMLPANILLADDEPDFELLISQRFRRQIREGEFSLG